MQPQTSSGRKETGKKGQPLAHRLSSNLPSRRGRRKQPLQASITGGEQGRDRQSADAVSGSRQADPREAKAREMAATRTSIGRKAPPAPRTRPVTRETTLLRRGGAPGESSRLRLRPFSLARVEASRPRGAAGTREAPAARSRGLRREPGPLPPAPPRPAQPRSGEAPLRRAQAEGRGEPSAAAERAGVDVSHGNAERAPERARGAGGAAACASPRPRSGRREPPGGVAHPGFTCRNAVPGIPSPRLFPRVTRGTFDSPTPTWGLLAHLDFQARAELRVSLQF